MEALDAARKETITRLVRAAYPQVEGIYLFGSAASDTISPDSDVDIAVLLPHRSAKAVGSLSFSDTRFALEEALGRSVDLVNARIAPIVLQKEIVATGIPLFSSDPSVIQGYEMIVLSLYGKLNEERRGILADFYHTRRAYRV